MGTFDFACKDVYCTQEAPSIFVFLIIILVVGIILNYMYKYQKDLLYKIEFFDILSPFKRKPKKKRS